MLSGNSNLLKLSFFCCRFVQEDTKTKTGLLAKVKSFLSRKKEPKAKEETEKFVSGDQEDTKKESEPDAASDDSAAKTHS